MSTSSLPTSMKAWTITHRGSPSKVLKLADVPTPTSVGPTEVLVQVSHVGLNSLSTILMWIVPGFARQAVSVPEFDLAGRVVQSGANVRSELAPGTDVFGMLAAGSNVSQGRGSLGQYVVVDQGRVTTKPENVSFVSAAAAASAASTAYELVQQADLKRGDSVLVNGASGGVGLYAVTLAKRAVGETGRVVAVCSGPNAELVKKAGADEVVDYTLPEPLHQRLAAQYGSSRFAAVIDTVGSTNVLYNKSPAFLATGRPFLTIGTPLAEGPSVGALLRTLSMRAQNTLWPRVLGGTPRSWTFVEGDTHGLQTFEAVRALLAEGAVEAKIDSEYEMEQVPQGYERVLSRRAKGKVVVKVQDI